MIMRRFSEPGDVTTAWNLVAKVSTTTVSILYNTRACSSVTSVLCSNVNCLNPMRAVFRPGQFYSTVVAFICMRLSEETKRLCSFRSIGICYTK